MRGVMMPVRIRIVRRGRCECEVVGLLSCSLIFILTLECTFSLEVKQVGCGLL
jgi:hypothetical protein